MKPAVFLDRDGVLTVEKSYVCSVDKLEIFSYAKECVKKIHEKNYYAIVITNQSGIARGLFTEKTLLEMNDLLIKMTGVDAVYYCPHHKDGKVLKYAFECNCRKPEIGMITRACGEFDIDIDNSYMVGDRAGDIIMGQKTGIKTVLLESGYGTKRLEEKINPDYIFYDLRDFTENL